MARQIVSGEIRQPYGANSYYTPAEWAMAAQEYIDSGYDDAATDLPHMVQHEDEAEDACRRMYLGSAADYRYELTRDQEF